MRFSNLASSARRRVADQLYRRQVKWQTLDELASVEVMELRSGEPIPLAGEEVPLLEHPEGRLGEYERLPPARTAELRDVLFCPAYRIAMLDPFRVLADTVNDAYPFRIRRDAVIGPVRRSVSEPATNFRGRWGNYYHTLLDTFPRLQLLADPHFDRYDDVQLLCPGGLHPFERILLEKMPLPDRFHIREVDPEKVYEVDRFLHLPFPSRRFCGSIPRWYRDTIAERLLPQRPCRREHRILISREGAQKRRMVNFDDLVAALRPEGFEVYRLEELTPDEQIELFYDAEMIVGAHGAGLTNAIFSAEVQVLEIFPDWYVLPHYLFLCRSMGHEYAYYVSRPLGVDQDRRAASERILKDLSAYNDADFTVDVNRVLSTLGELRRRGRGSSRASRPGAVRTSG
jgi:hypothetical protein